MKVKQVPPWVWIAVAVGIAVHAAALLLLRVRTEESSLRVAKRPLVTMLPERPVEGDAVTRERFVLLDPEPLFAPTKWNAGSRPLPEDLQRQPGGGGELFRPQLVFSPERLAPIFDPPLTAPTRAVAALAGASATRWESFARRDQAVGAMEARDAAIEVHALRDGGIVWQEALRGLPELVRNRDWEPAEFSVAVAASGEVGAPSLAISSKIEAIDAFFRVFIAKNFHLGERLPPGFYRVMVGP